MDRITSIGVGASLVLLGILVVALAPVGAQMSIRWNDWYVNAMRQSTLGEVVR